MQRCSFWVPGTPVGYKRATARHGYLPQPNAVWRRDVVACFREQAMKAGLPMGGEHQGAVVVALAFHGSKGDLDNLAKEVLDALNGVAYADDRQVCQLEVVRGRDAGHEKGAHIMLTLSDEAPMPQAVRGRKAVS